MIFSRTSKNQTAAQRAAVAERVRIAQLKRAQLKEV